MAPDPRAKSTDLESSGVPPRFVAALGHELRTPLQVIVMLTSKLERSAALAAQDAKDVKTIRNNVNRMNRLISDLLDFTRGNLGGGISLEPHEANLHELVTQALAELRIAHPQRQLELTTAGDGTGHFDGDRMVQVLSNLVTNAVKYGTPNAPVRVHVEGADGDLLLTVENHGPSIPVDAQPYLFDPFRRASSEAGMQSLGLGLAIVKSIAIAHGGNVDVESSAEGVTRFSVVIPRGTKS